MSNLEHCRTCAAHIRWFKTTNGKTMPVDAEPIPDGNLFVNARGMIQVIKEGEPILPDIPRYKSHFATCPHSAQHRKTS